MNRYLALACQSAVCAPPPVGTGGSERLWGKGIGALFPDGSGPVASAPWPRARRSKKLKDYDEKAVGEALKAGVLEDVDPRDLRASQPSVTAPGVTHYLQNDAGRLYADADRPTNKDPLVYERTGPDGVVERILLIGHHRGTAALLKGEPLRAVVARGGFGGPR